MFYLIHGYVSVTRKCKLLEGLQLQKLMNLRFSPLLLLRINHNNEKICNNMIGIMRVNYTISNINKLKINYNQSEYFSLCKNRKLIIAVETHYMPHKVNGNQTLIF